MTNFSVFLIIAIYLLPSFIGFRKRNIGAIIVANVLLGWTVIGWVAVLIWALRVDKESGSVVVNNYQENSKKSSEPSLTEKLKDLTDARDAKLISEYEYQERRNKLLTH